MISVYFDGDQTLWDFRGRMRRSLQAAIDLLVELCGTPAGDLAVDAFIADRDDVACELGRARATHEELRARGFARSLVRLGIPDPDGEISARLRERFFEHRWSGVDLYPDAVPTLEALRAVPGVRVGLLSNGNSYPDRAGLGHFFDAVLFSQDVGADKPSPIIYDAAARALPARTYVMVGDSLTDDVVGAHAAGWQAAWVNRDGEACHAGVSPDLVVRELTDVVPWITNLAG